MSLLTIFFHSTQTSINTTRIAKKQSHNLQISNNLTILRSAKIVQANAEQNKTRRFLILLCPTQPIFAALLQRYNIFNTSTK